MDIIVHHVQYLPKVVLTLDPLTRHDILQTGVTNIRKKHHPVTLEILSDQIYLIGMSDHNEGSTILDQIHEVCKRIEGTLREM